MPSSGIIHWACISEYLGFSNGMDPRGYNLFHEPIPGALGQPMGTNAKTRLEQRYQDAHERVVVLKRPKPAILQVIGPDGLVLLNRMSTNDLINPQRHTPITTVFTNANARIIEIATVLINRDTLLLLCWHDSPSHLQEWLSSYIFFQDDVQLYPSEVEWRLFDFIGPGAKDALETLLKVEIGSVDTLHAAEGYFAWSEPLGRLARFRLLCAGELAQQIGGQIEGVESDQEDPLAEILRIEAGIPGLGTEIKPDTIPLEVGLWDHVSFSKGCYIGQEVIARMESRGKLAWTMTGVRSQQELRPGMKLRNERRSIGEITSGVWSPRFGWIGLAIVKPGGEDPQGDLTAGEHTLVYTQPLPFE